MSEEILTIMKMVEKVGLADIFHTSGLENVARPAFSTFPLFPQMSEEVFGITKMVEKVGLATFSNPEVWKMSARPTFSTIFMIAGTFSEIRGKCHLPWFGFLFFSINHRNYGKFTMVLAFFLRNPKNHCKFTMISMVSMIS